MLNTGSKKAESDLSNFSFSILCLFLSLEIIIFFTSNTNTQLTDKIMCDGQQHNRRESLVTCKWSRHWRRDQWPDRRRGRSLSSPWQDSSGAPSDAAPKKKKTITSDTESKPSQLFFSFRSRQPRWKERTQLNTFSALRRACSSSRAACLSLSSTLVNDLPVLAKEETAL